MVKEATEMLGDFICRETEIKLFRDLQDAVKQCPSDKAEDISSLASRLLRALIWLKSTRDKARTVSHLDSIFTYAETDGNIPSPVLAMSMLLVTNIAIDK